MKKYIEKDFPIGFLSQLAERESWRKEIYRPVYYLKVSSNFNSNLGSLIYKGATDSPFPKSRFNCFLQLMV